MTAGTAVDLKKLDLETLWHPLTQHRLYETAPPIVIDRAEGCYVYDSQGNAYLEGLSGLWCVNIGYGRTELADVAREAMARYSYLPLTFSHEPAVLLAKKLLEQVGFEGKVYFSSSGSEANEVAFKIARQYHAQTATTGSGSRYKIVGRYRGYHGNTMGALSATGQCERKVRYEPLIPGFVHVQPPDCYRCPFGQQYGSCAIECAQAIEDTVVREGPESVAAVVMEPIISGGGVLVAPDEYLPRVREICDRYGLLLILDEVVNGCGRTGSMFAHDYWQIKPDLLTLAKGIASGYQPLAATVVRQEVFEAFWGEPTELNHFRHVNTYGGHPVATAVGLRNLDILEREELVHNAAQMGQHLLSAIRAWDHPLIGDVRGRGLLIGLELVSDQQAKTPLDESQLVALTKHCLRRGVIVGRNVCTSPPLANVLILAPPLIIGPAEADILLTAVRDALDCLAEQLT